MRISDLKQVSDIEVNYNGTIVILGKDDGSISLIENTQEEDKANEQTVLQSVKQNTD
jgi:hypothetical protein